MGLAPTGKRRLFTAHTQKRHQSFFIRWISFNILRTLRGHEHRLSDDEVLAMRRRAFIAGLGATVASPLTARAQQAVKHKRRVGALIGFAEDDPGTKRFVAAFLKGLADLGWVSDRDVTIEFRYGAGDADRNRILAKELVGLNPDVILVNSTSATAAVQRETSTIPVVFVTVSDPVGSGFVASLPRPGGNITGFINVEGSIGGKWLELLKKVAPRTKRAALIFNPATATYFDYYWKPFEAAARAAGVTPILLPVSDLAGVEQAFATRDRDDGIVAMSDPFVTVNRGLINEKALQFRVPVVSGASRSGALISYAPDTEDNLSTLCILCGQDPSRRVAGRPAGATACQVRAGHQPEDRQGAQSHRPQHTNSARRRGD